MISFFHTGSVVRVSSWSVKVVGVNLMMVSVVATVTAVVDYWLVNWDGHRLV